MRGGEPARAQPQAHSSSLGVVGLGNGVRDVCATHTEHVSKKGSSRKQTKVRNVFSLLSYGACFAITGLCRTHLPPRCRLVKLTRTKRPSCSSAPNEPKERAVLAGSGRPAVWSRVPAKAPGCGGEVGMCEQSGVLGLRKQDGNSRPSHTAPSVCPRLEVPGAHDGLALGFKKMLHWHARAP